MPRTLLEIAAKAVAVQTNELTSLVPSDASYPNAEALPPVVTLDELVNRMRAN